MVSSIDCLPMSSCYWNPLILRFALSLIYLGQKYTHSCDIGVEKLLPCGNSVRDGIIYLCSEMRKGFRGKLGDIFRYGSGVTYDGVKIKLTGGKYYEFILHNIETKRRPVIRGEYIGS